MAFPIVPFILLILPLLEIAVFVIVGSQIGVLATIGLVIASTLLGAVLLRIQGFGVVSRIRRSMETGGAPGRELVDGLMIMAAGVLLVIPGFVTDMVGLLLFIPAVRNIAWRLARNRIVVVGGAQMGGYRNRRTDGRTIDLDADDYSTDTTPPPDPKSIDHKH